MGKRRKNSADAAPAAVPLPALAAELGLAADRVEQLAGIVCVPGDDFTDAGEIVFTESGAKKIRDRVTEDMREQAAPVAPRPPAPISTLHREDLKLTRVFRWSANVLAETTTGLEVVLTVRSSRHLEPGMVLRNCIRGELGWTYEGKLPRTIGERQLYFPPKPAASTQPKS